ncbi:MAG: hypothetical protein DRQ55_01000 [Planctomycetota bacterium]|nr:MAG: hypothetical protein DRQ55_01000 [Planctomycetota bacterium]
MPEPPYASEPDTSKATHRARVEAEQERQATSHLGAEALALACLTFMVALICWPNGVVVPWASVAIAAAAVRSLLPRRAPAIALGAALVGLVWGLGYVKLAPVQDPAEQTFLTVILVGMSFAGLIRLAVLPLAGFAWVLPLLTPPVAYHLTERTRGDLELALLLAAYAGMLAFALRRLSKTRRAAIELAVEHDELVAALHRARVTRTEAEHGLSALIEQASEMLTVISPTGAPLFMSPSLQRLMEQRGVTRPIELVHPDDRGGVLEAQAKVFKGRLLESPLLAFRISQPDSDDWQEVEGSVRLLTERPFAGAILVASHDVTHRNRMARQLAHKEDLIRALFEAAPDPIFYKDAEGRYLGCNEAYAKVVGRSPGAVAGLTDHDLHPADIASRAGARDREVLETGNVLRDEYWVEPPDGRRVLLDTVKCPFRDEQGQPIGVVGICRDITEYRELEDKLRQAATTDGLTGLMNRRRLDEVLLEEWARARRQREPVSVIMADVDHFGNYNDAMGHKQGDLALATVADVIRRCVARPGDVVARYGGEEFTLILPHTGAGGAMAVAGQVLQAVRRAALPHPASDAAEVVTISLGVATAVPEREQNVSSLVEAADAALYDAKHAGRNTVRAREA